MLQTYLIFPSHIPINQEKVRTPAITNVTNSCKTSSTKLNFLFIFFKRNKNYITYQIHRWNRDLAASLVEIISYAEKTSILTISRIQ